MAVSKRLRYEVLRRDDHACRYCGARAPEVKLTVDHVVPVALGGTDDPINLVAACAACNSGKSSSQPDAPLVANVADDALRWARAMELAADIARRSRREEEQFIARFDDAWQSFFFNTPDDLKRDARAAQVGYYRDASWRKSIAGFRGAGMDIDDLFALLSDVMARSYINNDRIWRYFCGACWREIKSRQEAARDLLAGDLE